MTANIGFPVNQINIYIKNKNQTKNNNQINPKETLFRQNTGVGGCYKR